MPGFERKSLDAQEGKTNIDSRSSPIFIMYRLVPIIPGEISIDVQIVPQMSIAITANFENHRTAEERRVQEIPGLSKQFDMEFFKNLENKLGIRLENIVYYKDDTHYFVMTAKKDSLVRKGVIRNQALTLKEPCFSQLVNVPVLWDRC